jgi:hypothetical protein
VLGGSDAQLSRVRQPWREPSMATIEHFIGVDLHVVCHETPSAFFGRSVSGRAAS